eukprot:GHRR01030068.1.p1 GENE.GHRR01030068.1~~GHRR01030068.1.p1  ORF type:complete len:276 (+),score=56.42 GHRR01030068.1:1219-2046(+)
MKHLLDQHGYILGKDLFIISYDWRIGIQGLEQTGGLKKIATHISDGVKENCGQKAIVISHSFGANVMAYMLQKPQSQKWKEANIKGWVPVGGPFGGAAATAWVSLLSGDFFKLFPILSNLLPVSLTSQMPTTVVGKSVYKFAFGLPSWGFMFPRRVAFDKEHVVVSTPTKNYTIEDQRQLLLDMGDVHGANLLEHSWNIQEAALQYGPIPGIDTYCLYSEFPQPRSCMQHPYNQLALLLKTPSAPHARPVDPCSMQSRGPEWYQATVRTIKVQNS